MCESFPLYSHKEIKLVNRWLTTCRYTYRCDSKGHLYTVSTIYIKLLSTFDFKFYQLMLLAALIIISTVELNMKNGFLNIFSNLRVKMINETYKLIVAVVVV